MSDRVVSLTLQAEEATRELPMPIIAFFFITFALFLIALGVTWSFRGTAYTLRHPRHDEPAHSAIDPDGSHS